MPFWGCHSPLIINVAVVFETLEIYMGQKGAISHCIVFCLNN